MPSKSKNFSNRMFGNSAAVKVNQTQQKVSILVWDPEVCHTLSSPELYYLFYTLNEQYCTMSNRIEIKVRYIRLKHMVWIKISPSLSLSLDYSGLWWRVCLLEHVRWWRHPRSARLSNPGPLWASWLRNGPLVWPGIPVNIILFCLIEK